MTKKQLAIEVINRLKKEYPYTDCTLDYDEAWKLLVSVRLAAQCTDARVNVVVQGLYEKFPDIEALADADVAEEAKQRGVTRSTVSMERAAKLDVPVIFAIGNAPTALIELDRLMREQDLKPELIIGVPVGFVNVVESKELILQSQAPHIVARGRKGGSNVAAAIVNALLYQLVHREGF